MARNLYDILRVRTDATRDEIAEGLHRVLEKHVRRTDEDSVNEVKFARIAYETLSDSDRRRTYDEKLERGNPAISAEESREGRTVSTEYASSISNDSLPEPAEALHSVMERISETFRSVIPESRLIRNTLFCLVGLVVVFLGFRHFGKIDETTQRAELDRESAKLENQKIEIARKVLRNFLKDPESAQFRNVEICPKYKYTGSPEKLIFGYVNARNSFGGYVGFREFIIDLSAQYVKIAEEANETVYPRCD